MNYQTTIKARSIPVLSIFAAGFLALGCAAMGGKVQAAEAPQYDTAIVAFGDLNLDSEQGVKVLYARLRNGAQTVCSSFEGRDLSFKRMWQTCVDRAVASAVVQVNRTSLTTLHNQIAIRSTGYR